MSNRFSPTRDFFSEETRSQYVKDLKYTVRDEKLRQLVERWKLQGLVKEVATTTSASVLGNGQVFTISKKNLFERIKIWLSHIRLLFVRE